MALTDDAHSLIANHLSGQSVDRKLAIDATCGKGADTLFLLRLGFKKVLAFDIQAKAIELTNQQLEVSGYTNADLIQANHEFMAEYLPRKSNHKEAQCIMFNLGYLPTADKTITTRASSTIAALDAALGILSSDGLISIMCYPGHPAGAAEKGAVENWLKGLDSKWQIEIHEGVAPKPTAPILYLIRGIVE